MRRSNPAKSDENPSSDQGIIAVANHVSAIKRARQNEKRRLRNKSGRATNRTEIKKFLTAVESGEGQAALPKVMAQLAGSAAKGVIPKKRASRKIARLAKKLHAAATQG